MLPVFTFIACWAPARPVYTTSYTEACWALFLGGRGRRVRLDNTRGKLKILRLVVWSPFTLTLPPRTRILFGFERLKKGLPNVRWGEGEGRFPLPQNLLINFARSRCLNRERYRVQKCKSICLYDDATS